MTITEKDLETWPNQLTRRESPQGQSESMDYGRKIMEVNLKCHKFFPVRLVHRGGGAVIGLSKICQYP